MLQTTYLERNNNVIFCQTRSTTSNQLSFKVPWVSNTLPNNAVKGESNLHAAEWCWAVKWNKFIAVLINLEAATQYIPKIIRCLCKADCSSGWCGRWEKLLWICACSSHQETKWKSIELIWPQEGRSSDSVPYRNTYIIHCIVFLI